MLSLLVNKCIKYVNPSQESYGETGEIGFYGGELYEGEIINNAPCGWGILQYPNGTYFEGNFDNTGMTNGRLVLFNADYLDGKFSGDKLQKGTLQFKDGDFLEGEWGVERARWNLKYGQLKNSNKQNIHNFSRNAKEDNWDCKNKEVHKTSDKNGFEVKYSNCVISEKKSISDLVYTCDGTIIYEEIATNGIKERTTIKLTSYIPFTKIEQFKEKALIKTTFKVCYGFDVETEPDNKEYRVTFMDLNDIHAKGQFELESNKFRFKGSLFYKDDELGLLKIKKIPQKDISIKFNEIVLTDMNTFCKQINEVCLSRFNDTNVYEFKRPQKKSKTEKAPEVIGNVINDIKSHNNCIIM